MSDKCQCTYTAQAQIFLVFNSLFCSPNCESLSDLHVFSRPPWIPVQEEEYINCNLHLSPDFQSEVDNLENKWKSRLSGLKIVKWFFPGDSLPFCRLIASGNGAVSALLVENQLQKVTEQLHWLLFQHLWISLFKE